MFHRTFLASRLSLATTALVASVAAVAAPPTPVTSTPDGALATVVRYADLDLSSNDGVAVLYRRLRAAAERVCRPMKSPALSSRAPWRECYETALGNAVTGIGSERLAALHGRRQPAQLSRAD